MNDIKLIIFDWDGTLMDSAGKIVACMQWAAKHCSMPVPSESAVRNIIGISLYPAIMELFSLPDSEEGARATQLLVDAYKTCFLEHDTTPCPLFEGTRELLGDLVNEGVPLAVATGKARRGLERAWAMTDTKHFFTHSRCADEAESKPSPDMLQQLLAAQSIEPHQAVMIGDTSYDMQMAKTIGMPRIAVSHGVHHEEVLRGYAPALVAHALSDIHQWWFGKR